MWRKISAWLLPISLALNLFFVILAVRHHPFLHPHPMNPRDVVAFLKANLSPADAAIMQQSFAAHAADLPDIERGRQDFPDRIRDALRAEPFDPDKLRAALIEARQSHQAMEDGLAAALVEAASRISAEGRAKLAASEGPGGFRRRGGPPGPPPPDGGNHFGPGHPPGPPPGPLPQP
jgi:uncharacterized membrane protein